MTIHAGAEPLRQQHRGTIADVSEIVLISGSHPAPLDNDAALIEDETVSLIHLTHLP